MPNFSCLKILGFCLTALAFLCLINGTSKSVSAQTTPAETIISNQAQAVYADETGQSYEASSQIVSVTVVEVHNISVTPDETVSSGFAPQNSEITRIFKLTNVGNIPDSYIVNNTAITSPAEITSLFYDIDESGTVTPGDQPITMDSTISPKLLSGQSVNVLCVIKTNDLSLQAQLTINLTARLSQNSRQDTGKIINTIGLGVRLTAPDNADMPPMKLVNNEEQIVSATGQTIEYAIGFRNRGNETATQVLIADNLPADVEYVAGTLHFNGRILTDANDTDEGSVSGRQLKVLLPQIAPDEVVWIKFQTRVISGQNGSIINYVLINGGNFQPLKSTDAVVVVDPFGTVFAGHSGGSILINNARMTLTESTNESSPVGLPQSGFVPNKNNQNPYLTVENGRFNFTLGADQTGTPTAPANYVLRVEAANYRSRLISVKVTPNGDSTGLYSLKLEALDAQPLARAGDFSLTTEPVVVNNLAALGFNVPLFENSALTIEKNADRPNAEIGDVVSYRVNVQNPTQLNIQNLIVRDELPADFVYAENSAQIQDESGKWINITPEIIGNTLLFRFPSLSGGARLSIAYRVRVGANARAGTHVNTATAEGVFANGETIKTPSAQASVRVSSGIFATRQVVIGRVFEDVNGNKIFDAGDRPISGARIYTNKGQSVVTDTEGMYNFPLVEDGAFALILDKISLPDGYELADEKRSEDKSFERLLRTPLLGGGLLKQDFALKSIARSQNETEQPVSNFVNAKLDDNKKAEDNKQSENSDSSKNTINSTTQTTVSGTYNLSSTEKIEAIAAGSIEIVSPKQNEVIMSPALELEARVAQGWTIALTVNDVPVSVENISMRRVFNASQVESFTFVGITLRPGPNKIVAKAISSDGREGMTKEFVVMGRGAVKSLKIYTDKNELRADGRDTSQISVRALDAWGNPALDTQVALSVSLGSLLNTDSQNKPVDLSNQNDQTNQSRQQILNLKDGVGIVKINAGNAPGEAEITALSGQIEAKTSVQYLPELRPRLLVGFAEGSFGRSSPMMDLRGVDSSFRGRLGFFFRGRVFGNNLLTLSYDSERSLNRTNGRNRLFELDPLERAYSVFGDSSQRFEDAPSNSKLYARFDRGRSFAMFGDFETELGQLSLSGYSRKLTGVKLHLENSNGDFISVTGARPDTSFARDVFAGYELGLVTLTNPDILPGSESITLETRDRRNPEIILSREKLVRSVDYNLDVNSGQIFFLRPLTGFDSNLNLVQAVITYEYFANGNSSNVYTARASKNLNSLGLRLGFSMINQRQDGYGAFYLGGFDGEKTTFNGGKVRFEYAMSRGQIATAGNLFEGNGETQNGVSRRDGNAFRVEYEQPLDFKQSVLRMSFARADAKFFNPFGATVSPGSQRGVVSLEMKPRNSSQLKLGFTDERNETENVDNQRSTFSVGWTEQFSDKLRFRLGYDFRRFTDNRDDDTISSNLVTAGIEWKPTEKLQFAITREQNLGEADPTYPNQTTLSAKYQVNNLTNVFFTQRLASDAIKPISDVSVTGFSSTGTKRETAFGVETKLFRFAALNGRYQIENGINGTDSFAVVGLQNRFSLSKNSSIEFGFERGFHLAGNGKSFNSLLLGYSWQNESFRASTRFELRDKIDFGNILTAGAAGKIGDNITVLGRLQFANGTSTDRENSSLQGTLALALRPLKTDKFALLFSYNSRSLSQQNKKTSERTTDRADTFSTDGLWQASSNLEFYGRIAAKFGENSRLDLPGVSTLTYLAQGRVQYRFAEYFDIAAEGRFLNQPASQTRRTSTAAEFGYWVLPDLRFGLGYNFTNSYRSFQSSPNNSDKDGVYFNVTTKLSRIFNLFDSIKKNEKPKSDDRLLTDNSVTPEK